MTGGLAETSTFLSYLLSVFISLAIVLVLAWLALKFLAGRMGSLGFSGRNIRIIETTPLGYRRSLHIVEVEGKVLLIGSTEGGVTLLAELDPESLKETDKGPGGGGLKFLDFLKGKK
jgi:flagellar biosynthetic protein FliO